MDEQDIKLIARRLFNSDHGELMLAWILDKCKFMERCETEMDMALNNFSKELMYLIYQNEDGSLNPSFLKKVKKLFSRRKNGV